MLHAEKLIDSSCLDLNESQLAQVVELMARYVVNSMMDKSVELEAVEIIANLG